MSLEQEKFREEFEQYKKSVDKRIHCLEVNNKALYEGIVSLKNKFTSMVSPIELKVKKHLQWHEFWYNFCKYLILIISGVFTFGASVYNFFRDLFK